MMGMNIEIEMELEIDKYRDSDRDRDADRARDVNRKIERLMLPLRLLLLTLQPHNIAHPQPFSDGEVGTVSERPFGFPRSA